MLSIIIRNVNIKYSEWNFIIDTILNIDQLLLLIITYNINFMNGGIEICGQEVGLSSQKKTNLKRLHQKSHTNWQNKSKEDKISLIIYVILSLIWNILNLAIILLVAKLNNTLIECIFILTSFWLSKRSFGKAFHLIPGAAYSIPRSSTPEFFMASRTASAAFFIDFCWSASIPSGMLPFAAMQR